MNDIIREDLPPVGFRIPLLFSYRDTLSGDGFRVEVTATNGRALCVHEPDGFWMYGINPGGMAATGESPESAHTAFRQVFSRVLIDLVAESPSFEAFQVAVQQFFEETNEGYEPDWYAAVESVRRNETDVVGLIRLPAGSPREIRVEMKKVPTVQDNLANFHHALAA
jgi:hypothetical protein